ncbi:hypothetical protein [Sulfurimonas autotrophica]|uniref:AsmA family protein n=1 Tax=Sulfurimonas autotrophica (strain ATCC BAA-671 / DSM 16294 / JCM 11897 / OK10) TaxID=563040 RepID=E0UV74_SULAO|nr:hypothetical protein [Sulfurimonas autotrophica]ADN09656.1 conserved hypothetical protein [Sulfurimonas autotrophica DSM 16294]
MKYLTWLIGAVAAILIAVYVTAFTGFGNSIIKSVIEDKIKEQTKLDSKLKVFSLSINDFQIVLQLNKNNTIKVEGTYSIFSKSFDVKYSVNLQELKTLQPLTSMQLQDSFFTDGTVKGNDKLFTVLGKSDVAKSKTDYKVVMTDLNPSSIMAKVDTADLQSLLHILNQKLYASADVNLNVNFKNITPHKLDGDILLITKNGKLNSRVMKKDFNITIPATAFAMNLDAKLKGDNVDYTYILNSNLAKITSGGKIVPELLKVDAKYALHVKELAVLKPITSADIRGKLNLNGTVHGNKAKMVIKGKSDLASSNTTFSATLHDFAPKSVEADIKGLKLQKLLYMVKQPHFADALFNMNVKITNADPKNLSGIVKSQITKGVVDSKYVTKAYKFKSRIPRTTFSAVTYTTLNKNLIDTKLNFVSNLANFDIKGARFNTKDASLKSDYKVKVHNLDRLYFATQRHLKGALSANGELKKAKDLNFTLLSNVAGGKLDAKLHNDDFVANLNALQTLDILDMLIYPKVFKSSIDGKLVYNLADAKGDFKGLLSNGTFMRNQVLDLTKQYAHIDLYKQHFKGDVNAKINKEKIIASLDLKSNTSSIQTKNTRVDSKANTIDSKIDINANGNPLSVTLKGNINRPKIGVDAKKIIKKEATKAIKKEIQKRIGKDVGNLLKGLF